MRFLILFVLLAVLAFGAFVFSSSVRAQEQKENGKTMNEKSLQTATAIFAGGCFWCVESAFQDIPGILEAISGYTGGHVKNPTYKQVSHGGTGHFESVRVVYDPEKISYEQLLYTFWRNVDPFDGYGQFCDKGNQYRAAIFYGDESEEQMAETSKATMEKRFDRKIETLILPAQTFYDAEDYHQDYYRKNSWRYKYYRGACKRDPRLKEIWGDEAGGQAAQH